MAKKSEIIGEFIVTIDDNNSVSVSRIYKSTMAALREIASLKEIEVLKTWTPQHLGRLLLKQFCNGEKEGAIGEYTIEREDNNRINVIRTYNVAKDGLKECAESIDFPYEKEWNTQNFGRRLVIYAQALKTK